MLTKEDIIDAAKSSIKNISPGDENRTSDISRCFLLTLDDLSTRLRSRFLVARMTQSVPADSREIDISNDGGTLRYLFALKFGDNSPLTFVGREEFLENYDSSKAAADTPAYYTVIVTESGGFTVRFNCPLSETLTLTVYWLPEISQNNIGRAQSSSAIVSGILAFFYMGTTNGIAIMAQYKESIAMLKASDYFLVRQEKRIVPSDDERNVRNIQREIWSKRA